MQLIIWILLQVFPLSFGFFQFLGKSSIVKPQIDVKTLQQNIKNISANKDNGIKVAPEDKVKILEIVKDIEAKNPSSVVSSNPKMTGKWDLIYTSNTGSSAGKLGPFIGKVVQDIDIENNSYVNYAFFGNGLFEASLVATWDNLSAKTWRVKFQTLTFKLAGIKIVEKSLVGSVGIWRMTYLDDNLRILYAKGKESPSAVENIYILGK
jgi:hypothetical protein